MVKKVWSEVVSPAQLALRGALRPLERVEMEMEATWGFDVMPDLVSADTAARFASASEKLKVALQSGELAEVTKRAEVLVRGWNAMEVEARLAGHSPLGAGRFWFSEAEDGTRFCFVASEANVFAARKLFPDCKVWAMAEVMKLLGSGEMEAVNQVRERFPGAVVSDVRVLETTADDDPPF